MSQFVWETQTILYTGELKKALLVEYLNLRIFLHQACRGERADSGVQIHSDSTSKDQEVYTIPNLADILIMYATVEGNEEM